MPPRLKQGVYIVKVKLIDQNVNAVNTILTALGKCRNKECSQNTIKTCIRNSELSCLEFCWFAFEINGVSRVLLAEITRHRHFSFMVASQRHIDMSNTDFFIPDEILDKVEIMQKYNETVNKSLEAYEELRQLGVSKQLARYVLPNATLTNMVVAGNGRVWFEYLQKRLCKAKVQPEHFELAKMIWKILMKDYDYIYGLAMPCLNCKNQCELV